MAFKRSQEGLSLISFIFTSAVIVVFALVGFRVLPAYVEYYAVEKALQATLNDDANQNPGQIRNAMGRRIDSQYIDSIKEGDIQVQKLGNAVVAQVSWQRVLHMVGNASILLEFTAEATR
jgi:hypothetical protein